MFIQNTSVCLCTVYSTLHTLFLNVVTEYQKFNVLSLCQVYIKILLKAKEQKIKIISKHGRRFPASAQQQGRFCAHSFKSPLSLIWVLGCCRDQKWSLASVRAATGAALFYNHLFIHSCPCTGVHNPCGVKHNSSHPHCFLYAGANKERQYGATSVSSTLEDSPWPTVAPFQWHIEAGMGGPETATTYFHIHTIIETQEIAFVHGGD